MSFLLKKVQENIEKLLQNPEKQKFLLAVSGGMDSMILLDVFYKLNLSFHVAHVNFQLRGEESSHDELFVLEQSKKYLSDTSKIHIQRFDTLKEQEKTKDTSIQMLARKLRYEWFYTLLNQYQLDYVVTAHHADDNIETFFVKLFRKSSQGLAGMDILSKNRLLRPLVTLFRSQIYEYAKENNIPYREDSSNFKDDYLRNHIRNHLIPFLENNYPQAKNAILDTMRYQRDLNILTSAYTSEIWDKSVSKNDDCHTINLTALQQYPLEVQEVLPWHFAERFCTGMKQFEQFKHLFDLETRTGKEMLTQTHRAVRYKQSIQVFPPNKHVVKHHVQSYYNEDKNREILEKIPEKHILICSDTFRQNNINSCFENIRKIRIWYPGDRILHKGKEELIADLIPQYGITPYQKEYLYVAVQVTVQSAERDRILNPNGNKLHYSEKITFAFYCPNSVLLQLEAKT